MDTQSFLVARQDLLERLRNRRLVKVEPVGPQWSDLLKLGMGALTGLMWMKKSRPAPFAFAKILTGPISGALGSAGLAIIKSLFQKFRSHH